MHRDVKPARTALRVLDCGGAPPLWKACAKAGQLVAGKTKSSLRVFLSPQRGEELKVRGENRVYPQWTVYLGTAMRVGLGTSIRPNNTASPKTTSEPTTPAKAVAATAQ